MAAMPPWRKVLRRMVSNILVRRFAKAEQDRPIKHILDREQVRTALSPHPLPWSKPAPPFRWVYFMSLGQSIRCIAFADLRDLAGVTCIFRLRHGESD